MEFQDRTDVGRSPIWDHSGFVRDGLPKASRGALIARLFLITNHPEPVAESSDRCSKSSGRKSLDTTNLRWFSLASKPLR
jgi:hypothetical protein